MIRTTFWTIDSESVRPDEGNIKPQPVESDPENSHAHTIKVNAVFPDTSKLDMNNMSDVKFVNSQTPIIAINSQNIPLNNKAIKKSLFKKIVLNWICGFDDENKTTAAVGDASQEKIQISLNQTKFEKWILNTNLVFIICISVGLFIFFSIPPEKHIFKHLNKQNNN